jgi:hypothetical protein
MPVPSATTNISSGASFSVRGYQAWGFFATTGDKGQGQPKQAEREPKKARLGNIDFHHLYPLEDCAWAVSIAGPGAIGLSGEAINL